MTAGHLFAGQLSMALPVVSAPLTPDPPAARELARRELSKGIYQEQQPGLLERFQRWVGELLDEASAVGGTLVPGGWIAVLLLLVLAAALVALVVYRTGGFTRTARAPGALFTGDMLTAARHRALAEEHATAGRWAEAVRERMRALARGLEERGLLDGRPGRTADEIAVDAGAVLPALSEDLRRAARRFDDIWYGGRTATREAYDAVRAVDDEAVRSRPAQGVPA